jgi:hypothetical protein
VSSITADALPSTSVRTVAPSRKKPPEYDDILKPELKAAATSGSCPSGIWPGDSERTGWTVPDSRCACTADERTKATPTTMLRCKGSGGVTAV